MRATISFAAVIFLSIAAGLLSRDLILKDAHRALESGDQARAGAGYRRLGEDTAKSLTLWVISKTVSRRVM